MRNHLASGRLLLVNSHMEFLCLIDLHSLYLGGVNHTSGTMGGPVRAPKQAEMNLDAQNKLCFEARFYCKCIPNFIHLEVLDRTLMIRQNKKYTEKIRTLPSSKLFTIFFQERPLLPLLVILTRQAVGYSRYINSRPEYPPHTRWGDSKNNQR